MRPRDAVELTLYAIVFALILLFVGIVAGA